MSALFFIFFTVFLIVVQTIVLPDLPFFMQCFDLMIINVLFLCLVSTRYTTVLSIVVIGVVMDSLSGVPFFYHLFSYLWIYILVYLVRQVLFQRSMVFVLVISMVSVLIQHGLLLFSIFVRTSGQEVLEFDFSLLILQVILGFVFIPPGVWLASAMHRLWMKTGQAFRQKVLKARHG